MTVISSSKDIKKILSTGKKLIFKDFIIIFQKNNFGYPRFAFIVSKKVSKRAVDRNRAKRLLREIVRKYYRYISDKGFDIIFIARKSIIDKKLQDLESEFQEFLKTLGNDSKTTDQNYTSV